jgi:hypothetical protein
MHCSQLALRLIISMHRLQLVAAFVKCVEREHALRKGAWRHKYALLAASRTRKVSVKISKAAENTLCSRRPVDGI